MDKTKKISRFLRQVGRRLEQLNQQMYGDFGSAAELGVLLELARHSGRGERRSSVAFGAPGVERRTTPDRREKGMRKGVAAGRLASDLGLDPGYLSRILKIFQQRGWAVRQSGFEDRRQGFYQLTPQGREQVRSLEKAAQARLEEYFKALTLGQQEQLLSAMETLEHLSHPGTGGSSLVIRPFRSGDLGWVLEAHARIYLREYGWGRSFEATVARVIAGFAENFKPEREACFIAERDAQRLGSVMLLEREAQLAQIRLLLVEPSARGAGIATLLLKQCREFARQVGYSKILVWTQSVLTTARRIYVRAGYRLVEESVHTQYGEPLKGETWVLDL